MLIYAYNEKKGLINLTKACTIEYYGSAQRQVGIHEGTMLVATYENGNKYILHGITLDEIYRSLHKGESKTFFIQWEQIGPTIASTVEFK